jgi:chromosomal replication initiator protein
MAVKLLRIWDKVLAALKKDIGEVRYDLWIRKVEMKSFSDERVEISTPNVFVKEWLSTNYKRRIAAHIVEITGHSPEIVFLVDVSMAKPLEVIKPEEPSPNKCKTRTLHRLKRTQIFPLNQDFRLDTFIVGSCNRVAFHTSEHVCQELDGQFNPFFIYGGCGLGKTHLLQAITRELTRNFPGKKILYISSEYFVNAFIQAVRDPSLLESFRRKFRSQDALIIDDVHILAGKERTQEEFLHTFNTYWNRNSQIVMASDSHPRAIRRLRKELTDRFSGGLITELKLPSYQTRLGILRRKAEKFTIDIPDKVLTFMARKLPKNVRVIEGALNAVVASALYCRREVTMDLAWLTLKEISQKLSAPLSMEEIENLVISKFSVTSKDLHARNRSRTVLVPRQVCMYLARKYTSYSLSDIGHYFSGRNHSIVLHAEKRVQVLMKKDQKFSTAVQEIEKDLD